nr:hypothetical protein GCM10020063_030410 [Dactylosporangium thailandense]
MNQVFNADGTPFTAEQNRSCMTGEMAKDFDCLGTKNLHFQYTYQPGSRYWPFQWLELAAYSVLAAALSAFGFWWIRRRVS